MSFMLRLPEMHTVLKGYIQLQNMVYQTARFESLQVQGLRII